MDYYNKFKEHSFKGKEKVTQNQTYVPWSLVWQAVLEHYPDATYEIHKFQNADGTLVPSMYDENLGYMVETEVTIDGVTRSMWRVVMDSKNKAMKKEPYSYRVKDYRGQMAEKTVAAATFTDINNALMRCLAKNIAMFGLGLYLYTEEDAPPTEEERVEANQKEDALQNIMNVCDPDELKMLIEKWGPLEFWTKAEAEERLKKILKKKEKNKKAEE